jgi:RNA-binding protein
MALTPQQIRYLKSLAHHLKPIVMIGNKGVNDNVLVELDLSLEKHELIKVSIAGADRIQRRDISETLCQKSGADLVQMIGRISVLYRASQKPKLFVNSS